MIGTGGSGFAGTGGTAYVFAAVRSMPPGTVVRLPEEHGGRVGYKHYTSGGASYVLVPGVGAAKPARVGLAPETEVEIIATPVQLADRYLRGELDEIDGRPGERRPAADVIELRPGGNPGHPPNGRGRKS